MDSYRNKSSFLLPSSWEGAGKASYQSAHLNGNEAWLDVSGYTGLYQVSNFGNIRDVRTGRVLRGFKADKAGHLGVDLRRRGQRPKRQLVHRLVAHAWIPQTARGTLPAHKSDDITDNRIVNLEWLTPAENAARWYVRRGGRPRDTAGRFADVMSEIEAEIVHSTVMGGR
jgi:hypothetical protein